MNKIYEATFFFLLKSEKKEGVFGTDEGGPEKPFFLFGLTCGE